MTISAEQFKQCLSRFCSGVTVMSFFDDEKKPYGLTVSSFASVSLSPPLVLFCIDKNASIYKAFEKTDGFCVNILSESQQQISQIFASPATASWNDVPHFINNEHACPVLHNTLASFACTKHTTHDAGDHTIIIGKVALAHHMSDEKPLGYFKGGYVSLKG